MRATAILRGAAAAFIVAFGTLSSASANHRGHGHGYHGGPPAMHHGGYRHGPRMRQWEHGGMHHRHGYRHRRAEHHRDHDRHHAYGGHRGHHGGFAGRPAFFPRPYHRPGYRHHRFEAQGYFPRPRLHRPRAYGAYGYGYHPRYRALPAFAGPAYYPYSHGVSHGFHTAGYGYPAYPISSYGTIAGGSLYAPLYNRPACACY